MSAPLYTHPSLRPGFVRPVPSGNGEAAPTDGVEFHLRPSTSSSLSLPPSICPCSQPHGCQIFNGGEPISVTHGLGQPAVNQPCACNSENLAHIAAPRRPSAASNLASVRESESASSATQQDLHCPSAFSSNSSLTAKRTSQSSLSPRSSVHTRPHSQPQVHSQCTSQTCLDEELSCGGPLDVTNGDASSLRQAADVAATASGQTSTHPPHRHWHVPRHLSHYSREHHEPESVVSIADSPFHNYMPFGNVSPRHSRHVDPNCESVCAAENHSFVPKPARPARVHSMSYDVPPSRRRSIAREQSLLAGHAGDVGSVQEASKIGKQQLSISPLVANSMQASRGNSLPNANHGRRTSDAYSSLHDRRNAALRMPLQSPCFFHQRFENAVNISHILNEIEADDWISHSRLVATATGVREVSRQLQRRQMKMEVRSVLIVTKARDNRLVYLTRELAEWLMGTPRYNNGNGNGLGVKVYVDAKLQKSRRFDAPGLLAKNPAFADMLNYWTIDMCWACPEKFDLVLTLGGDGTVLFTSWLFQRVVPPVLSFSLGSLGFLTHFEFSRYKEHLNRIMGETGMRVNLRMRFTCTVIRVDRKTGEEREDEQFEVVNELVIDRGPSPWVSNLELYADGELLTVVQADGCIFSTPTGSTAYSLSAGGSLVHPSIPAILLTPICPHTLSFRPMVLSDSVSLKIAVPAHSRSTAYCSFDGKSRTELRQGDYVTVEASQYPFPTVVSGSGEWFDSVRRALRWNTRGAVQRGWGASHSEDPLADVGEVNLGSNMAFQDLDEDADEPWDIDADSNSDVMHYEALSSSSRRSQLLSRSATRCDHHSNSASSTVPDFSAYKGGGIDLPVKPTAPEHVVEPAFSPSQRYKAHTNGGSADELPKLEALTLADGAEPGAERSSAV